jgi:Cu2+-exporting ATPase
MEQGLGKLCDLRDIARRLDQNIQRSWGMIIVPNMACVAGVFTLGFGVGASVLTNNVAAIGALANGVWPLREVAKLEAERRHLLDLELSAHQDDKPLTEETPALKEAATPVEKASTSRREPRKIGTRQKSEAPNKKMAG